MWPPAMIFLYGRHPGNRDAPGGLGRPSLIFSCFETKQFAPGGLRPGGKISPPLRLDGPTSEPALDGSVGPTQNALSALPAGRRSDLPLHNALASKALGDALDGEKREPKEIGCKLHVNWGHVPSQQLKRTMAVADGKANGLIPLVGDVVRECEICRAFDVAPAIPASATSAVSSPNEKVRASLPVSDDLITLNVLDLVPRYSALVPVWSKNPEEAWDTFRASPIAVFGEPQIIQMGEGGEWENDLRFDLRADRYIKSQFQGVGAHPWISERRNGPVRGIYDQMNAEGRRAGRQLIAAGQCYANTTLSTNGFSAYQMVCCRNPVEDFCWGSEDEELLFAQGMSLSGQFVASRKLRMLSQEVAIREFSNSKLRRILPFNTSFDSVAVRVGDKVLFYRAPSRKRSPRRRGPARVLLLGESGATFFFRERTFKVARHCVRRKVRAPAEPETPREDAFGDPCRPTPPRKAPEQPPDPPLGFLDLYKRRNPTSPGPLCPDFAPSGERTRFGMEESQNDVRPVSPDPPQRSLPPRMATCDQGPLASINEVCAQTQGPPEMRTDYDDLSHRDLHDLCKQRGFAKKDPNASLCTRLRKMDEVESARGLSPKGNQTQQDAADSREPAVLGRRSDKRCRCRSDKR